MKSFIPFVLLASAAAFAQAPLVDTLVSPEVHSDRRVTFRVRAPKASEVSLFGDCHETTITQATHTRTRILRSKQGSVDVFPCVFRIVFMLLIIAL